MPANDKQSSGGVRTDGGAATEATRPALAVNHVGLTVPDIEAAVEWYQDVLGFTLVSPPTAVPSGSGHFADLFADIVGEFEEAKLAHLETANGVGFELFEYEETGEDNARNPEGDGNWQGMPGVHHIAVTYPDVSELAARIEDNGGTQHSDIWRVFPDQEYELVYMRDPWNNFIEIYNRSYTQLFANQD